MDVVWDFLVALLNAYIHVGNAYIRVGKGF